MLHFEAVEPETLVLLKNIQNIPSFSDFRLVGGTALALQFGHRKSIDLDFFGETEFDTINFDMDLSEVGEVEPLTARRSIKTFKVNNVKVDFVQYPYPWISDAINHDNIFMADIHDISAMKMAAIMNRGAKKDFFDLNLLLDHLSLKDMVENYRKKYHDGSDFLLFKSLNYFEEAEEDDNPEVLNNVTWQQVKERISKEYRLYMKELGM